MFRRLLKSRICRQKKLEIVNVRRPVCVQTRTGRSRSEFIHPHYASRALRGEGRIPFELFVEYTVFGNPPVKA